MSSRSLLICSIAITLKLGASFSVNKPFSYNESDIHRNYDQIRSEISTTSWDYMLVVTILLIILVIGLCVWEQYSDRPRDTDSLRTDSMTLLPPEKIHHKLTVCRLPDGFVPPIVTMVNEQKPVYELTVEQKAS